MIWVEETLAEVKRVTTSMLVEETFVTVILVPVAFAKLNPVLAVMVPEAETSKNLVAAVEEVIEKRVAVWAARPRMLTVELPTLEDCTVSLEVEVAPMP